MVNEKKRPTPFVTEDNDFVTFLSLFDDVSEIYKELPPNWGSGTELLEEISTKTPTAQDNVTPFSPSTNVDDFCQTASPWGAFVDLGNDSDKTVETPLPPSILCQRPLTEKVSEPPPNVKVKRKCGRPRNPIPRHKRVSHISAEHRRRSKIQDAFQTLKDLVPPQRHVSGRVSKADVLFRAIDKCQDHETDIRNLKVNMESLTAEKEALSLDVKVYKVLIQEEHNTDTQPPLTLDDLYTNYVEKRSKNNPCFKIFTLMMYPLFESFKIAVKDLSTGQFVAAVWDWAQNHLTLTNLRAAFVNTEDIPGQSDVILKDQEHGNKFLSSQTSTRITLLSPESIPFLPQSTNDHPFENSLNVFNTTKCLESNQDGKTLSMTSKHEHSGDDCQRYPKLDSTVCHPRDLRVTTVDTYTGSPCFVADKSNGCLKSKFRDCGPHKIKIRRTQRDENSDISNNSLLDDSQSNACRSIYQNGASRHPRLDSKNSSGAMSSPLQSVHLGIRNNAPTPFSIPAAMSEGLTGTQASQAGACLTHAILSGESDRSMFENVTGTHSLSESCHHTENTIDRCPTENISPSYCVQIHEPDSPIPSVDKTPSISSFPSPKINHFQSFMRSKPVSNDTSQSLIDTYLNSHGPSAIVSSAYQDKCHCHHTGHHLQHETDCPHSQGTHHDKINQLDSSDHSIRDKQTFQRQMPLGNSLESITRGQFGQFSFLRQLLGTPNSTNQSIEASGEENERISFVPDVTTTTAVHVIDICHISPSDRSKLYQPTASPASRISLLPTIDVVPKSISRRRSGKRCSFTAQSTSCQETWSPSEPSQSPCPDVPSFMPTVLTSDHVSAGSNDNMWSMTRSDQVVSPCSDDVIQRDFTSPSKMVHTADTNLAEIEGQGLNSLSQCHRTFNMENRMRPRNDSVSTRTSPLTYINMDAHHIVVPSDSKLNEKHLCPSQIPLRSHVGSGDLGGKMKSDIFQSPFIQNYSDFE